MNITSYQSIDSLINSYNQSVSDVNTILSEARGTSDNASGSDSVIRASLIDEVDLDELIKKVEAEYNKMLGIHSIVTTRMQKAEVSSQESTLKRWTFRVIVFIASAGTIAFTFLQIFTAQGVFDLSIYIGTAIIVVLAVLAELKDHGRKKLLNKLKPLTFEEMKDTHKLLCALKSWRKLNAQSNPSDHAVKTCLEKINNVNVEVVSRFCDRDLLVCSILEKLPEENPYHKLLSDAFITHNSGDIEAGLDCSGVIENDRDKREESEHCIIKIQPAIDSTRMGMAPNMMLSREGSKHLIDTIKIPLQRVFYNNMAATMPTEISC